MSTTTSRALMAIAAMLLSAACPVPNASDDGSDKCSEGQYDCKSEPGFALPCKDGKWDTSSKKDCSTCKQASGAVGKGICTDYNGCMDSATKSNLCE